VKGRDAFGVAVRTIGLLVVLAGHYYILSAIGIMMMVRSVGTPSFFESGTAPTHVAAPVNAALLTGAVSLAIGLLLLLRAEAFVNISYGKIDRT
jgi:hypothetical protein